MRSFKSQTSQIATRYSKYNTWALSPYRRREFSNFSFCCQSHRIVIPLFVSIAGVTLNIPAGMWGKTQFTPEEVATSRKISSARIHVERTIGYLKRYRLLRNKIPLQMLPFLSDIVFVCSELINLNPAFLREVDNNFRRMTSSDCQGCQQGV